MKASNSVRGVVAHQDKSLYYSRRTFLVHYARRRLGDAAVDFTVHDRTPAAVVLFKEEEGERSMLLSEEWMTMLGKLSETRLPDIRSSVYRCVPFLRKPGHRVRALAPK